MDVSRIGRRVGETQRAKNWRQIFWKQKQNTEASREDRREGERDSERSLKRQPPFTGSTDTQSTEGLSEAIEARRRNEEILGGKMHTGNTKETEGPHKGHYQNSNTHHTPFTVLEAPATLTGSPEKGD